MGMSEGIVFDIQVKKVVHTDCRITVLHNGKHQEVTLPYRNIKDLISLLKTHVKQNAPVKKTKKK